MACYVITFEPVGTSALEAIQQRLKNVGNYCPIHLYSWAVVTDMTAVQLRDSIAQAAPGSKVFVVRSGTEAAWINSYGLKNSEWLKTNL
jgi:hypothetical protein